MPAGSASWRSPGLPWSLESWARMSLLAEKCKGLVLFARDAKASVDQRGHNIVNRRLPDHSRVQLHDHLVHGRRERVKIDELFRAFDIDYQHVRRTPAS